MKWALCRSLVMVPICAGVYYDPEHKWCGREWAAMSALGARRLPPESDFGTIFSLLFTSDPEERDLLPAAVRQTQYRDISSQKLYPGFYSTRAFRDLIWEVVAHIKKVSQVIELNQVRPDCGEFDFPLESAFATDPPAAQPPPFYEDAPGVELYAG